MWVFFCNDDQDDLVHLFRMSKPGELRNLENQGYRLASSLDLVYATGQIDSEEMLDRVISGDFNPSQTLKVCVHSDYPPDFAVLARSRIVDLKFGDEEVLSLKHADDMHEVQELLTDHEESSLRWKEALLAHVEFCLGELQKQVSTQVSDNPFDHVKKQAFYTSEEVATELNVCVWYVCDMCRKKVIQAQKRGRRWLIPFETLLNCKIQGGLSTGQGQNINRQNLN